MSDQKRKLKLHFRRFEFKYFLTWPQYRRMKKVLAGWLVSDPYAGQDDSYLVTSLYFDSPGLRYYRENEAGIGERLKVRHRYYNDRMNRMFWEIKRKTGNVVVKDRCLAAEPATRIKKQLNGYRSLHRLRPVSWVRYRREPWVSGENHLRVTFDSELMVARAAEEEVEPGWWDRLLGNLVVMELKYLGRMPNWLYRLITEQSLERRAIGKYRMSVERLGMV